MKIIITENKIEKLTGKIIDSVDKFGLIATIKMFGGIKKFEKIVTEYFKSRDNKIILIDELIESDTEAEGRIYLYEIATGNVTLIIRVENLNNGHTIQHELDYVQEGVLGVTVWEYDKDGHQFDEPWDDYEIDLDDVKKGVLDTIFKIMVKHYLR